MDNEMELKKSPLSQKIVSNGKSVTVEICSDGKGKWLLEVIDDAENSTTWEDPFNTDQEALDEVLDTIKQEGIECLIGQLAF